MSASDILFDSIKKDVTNLFKDPSKVSRIDRIDLLKNLECTIEMHQKFSTVFSSLSTNDLFYLKDKFQQQLSKKSNTMTSKECLKLINKYFEGLGSTGRMIDKKLGPFASLNKVSTELYSILIKLRTRFNDYLPNPYITINDARLSTLSIIQFINISEVVCTTSEYLFTLVFDTISEYITPKYRYEYLNKHMKLFMRFMNDILEHHGVYDLVKNIDNMRKDGSDALLIMNAQPNNFAFIGKIGSAIKSFFIQDNASPMKGIGLFRRIGEVYDNWVHERYKKNQTRLEWMQHRVALFKADLQGLSQDSPEYQKLVKIVSVYDEEITKLDKKINNYLNEE
jgi:hypothetical protein